jgi:hypothetical protein
MEKRSGETQISKQTYSSPRLLRYGTFVEITEGGTGLFREPGGVGAPKSKATGTVA